MVLVFRLFLACNCHRNIFLILRDQGTLRSMRFIRLLLQPIEPFRELHSLQELHDHFYIVCLLLDKLSAFLLEVKEYPSRILLFELLLPIDKPGCLDEQVQEHLEGEEPS